MVIGLTHIAPFWNLEGLGVTVAKEPQHFHCVHRWVGDLCKGQGAHEDICWEASPKSSCQTSHAYKVMNEHGLIKDAEVSHGHKVVGKVAIREVHDKHL